MISQNQFLSAAIAGLLFTAGASTCLAHEAPHKKGEIMGECHGINACKGQGDCGGPGYECKGNNSCKGKGWLSMTKKDCEKKKGTFKAG